MAQAPNIREQMVDDQKRPTRRWWDWLSIPPTRFSGTVTVAKLTTTGVNGKMIFVNGVLVSQTPAT